MVNKDNYMIFCTHQGQCMLDMPIVCSFYYIKLRHLVNMLPLEFDNAILK